MAIDPKRVKEIFLEAAGLSDEAARTAYLDKACGGDASLRVRVEALLRSHDPEGSFLGTPAAVVPDPDHSGTMALTASPERETKPTATAESLSFLAPPGRAGSLGRIGHYEMLQVLGHGGFGIVFRAFDDVLQRVVAVKVMAPQIATTSPARKRFLREARSSAQVRHENVVQVYEVGEQPLPYLVMEFIPGETLQQKLDRLGPLDIAETLRIGRQVAAGLAAAHDHDLIHRDIKPGNILLESGPHGHAKITDFGLARAADDASISQSGIIAGTPKYMAPEQAQGQPLDHRADLFSLGSVLYQMVAGRPPFRASTTVAVLKRVAEDQPRAIREIIPEAPQWLCDIIAKLHAKNPDDRYQSAREVADVLADCEVQLRASSRLTDHSRIPRGNPRRSGRKWVAAAAVLLLPVIVLAVLEFAGVTHLLRQQESDPIKPVGDSPAVVVAKKETPADTNVVQAGHKESDPKKLPEEKKAPPPDPKPAVEVPPAAPSVQDTWIKATALLPLDTQGAAVAARMQEKLPGFEDAYLKALPTMPADRQAIMVDVWLKQRKPTFAGLEDAWLKAMPALPADVQATLAELWLKERKPAFAGFEDGWVKAIPGLGADTQVALVTVWLKERNPTFDGSLTHKAEGGVVTSLDLPAPIVQDLAPLRALSGLKTLTCRRTVGWDHKAESDAAVLKSLKALETINSQPVAQFWKDVKARQAEFKEWLKLVPSLTAKQQITAVAAKLQEHNPDCNDKVWHKFEDDVVTEIALGAHVADIRPVQALLGLKSFTCDQRAGGRLLIDLSPLKGLKQLTSLKLAATPTTDLSALKDLNLTSLSFGFMRVSDLTPLKDMKLTYLYCNQTGVSDLTLLKGMKLTYLSCRRTQVTDLTPLKGMPLTVLSCSETGVTDLTPLKDMPLTVLRCDSTQVTDLSPLKGLVLEEIRLTPRNITKGLEILRDMKSLKTISITSNQAWPAAEFWARYDKGMFRE